MNPWYPQVADRARHRCEYCRAPEQVFNFQFEVEHIIPVSRGGADKSENLALACRACNAFKSDRTEFTDPETNLLAPLFDPRTQTWSDHFEFVESDLEFVGKTPEGRATIDALTLNAPRQIEARRAWVKTGVFP